MKKELFSEIPYIKGDRVVLKKVTQAEADALREMTGSEAVYKWIG